MTDFLTNIIGGSQGSQSRIVAIDTSLGSSVAVSNGHEIFETSSNDPMAHAEVIGELLRVTLDSAGVKASDVTLVVGGAGPGPFTGLRVGLAAATAFAMGTEQNNKLLVSHDAVALEHYLNGNTGPCQVLQDAKRSELFISKYSGLDESGIPVRQSEPVVAKSKHDDESLEEVWPKSVSASYLVLLAERIEIAQREFFTGGALYLRQPDVNLKTKLAAGP